MTDQCSEPLEVAVLIVCHNGQEHIDDCLASVLASTDAYSGRPINKYVVVVDNASRDGTADTIADRYPEVELIRSKQNLGYAGGNNLAWDHARRQRCNLSYVAILNQDTIVADGWLQSLVAWLESTPQTASVQPLLLLATDSNLINTAGNCNHFLGFGHVTGYGDPDPGNLRPRSVHHASGAALLVRVSRIKQLGLFSESLFMYLEDVELSWKFRQMGYDNVVVPESKVRHKYVPGQAMGFYYYLERNRWWLLLVYYKVPTLILLLPAAVAMELIQLIYAAGQGQFSQKLKAYAFFFDKANLDKIHGQRRMTQRRRVISDRQFLEGFVGTIRYPTLTNPLLRFVVNPLFAIYWWLARQVIFW